jgi:hypothetical protein
VLNEWFHGVQHSHACQHISHFPQDHPFSGVSNDKGIEVFDNVGGNGKPGLMYNLLSKKSDATVGSGVA